jgi:hypothetical protein
MTNPYSQNPWALAVDPDKDAVRVLVMHHVQDDTYAIFEDGEVSLSDGANLILLLEQLSGRVP